jgi:4-hydroxy-tetrahydrodipicolinate reductase
MTSGPAVPAEAKLRVAVTGAAGRMGATVCKAVDDSPVLELVAAIDPAAAGRRLAELADVPASGLVIGGDVATAVAASAQVVVDFTHREAAAETLAYCAEHGLHAVCGTTGLDDATVERLAVAFGPDDRPNAVLCPNFAISAVLMMRFCELAAPLFDGVEIIELHHDDKRDAPSGTAVETARRIAYARRAGGSGDFAPDPTTTTVFPGARGAAAPAGVTIHSVRLRGLVAHQEVIFGALGQSLTIRQDSYDRTSFMPGVLLAINKVATTPGLTVGLDRLLDL